MFKMTKVAFMFEDIGISVTGEWLDIEDRMHQIK